MAENKFTIEMHRENMRSIIRPKPAGLRLDRIRQSAQTVKPRKPQGVR